MSIAVMATCWRHSQAKGTDLLVLLALADIADDNGECWPSIRHLAEKCRIDQRTCQRRIRSLEVIGEVVVIRCGGKSSFAGGVKSNRYRIVVHIPDDDPGKSPPPANRHDGTDDGGRVAPVPPMTLAPVPPDTSVEPPDEPPALKLIAPASPAAKHDEIFDALVEVSGINVNELTSSAKGLLNRSAKELRTVGATADEIHKRANVYRHRFTYSLTPAALVKHWATLTEQPMQYSSGTSWVDAQSRRGQTRSNGSAFMVATLQADWASDHPDEPVPPQSAFVRGGALDSIPF